MSWPLTWTDGHARNRGAPRVARGAPSVGGCGGPCRGPPRRQIRRAGDRLRPAALRVLSATISGGEDPDGATAAGTDRRAGRLLLPRQRPRPPRDTHHLSPSHPPRDRTPELCPPPDGA